MGVARESLGVIFGEAFDPAPSGAPAAWIGEERPDEWGTVGSLIPNRYEAIVRVDAPDSELASARAWWPAYRVLFGTIGAIGARHTGTPDRAWFAVWDGHGFDTATTSLAWPDAPPDDATRRARAAAGERARADDLRRRSVIGSALSELPTVQLPDREYYLLGGPVTAVTELRNPSSLAGTRGWQRPDLFWPDDRRWFVATDVDFWSLYVAGDAAFAGEVRRTVPTPTETVVRTDGLVIED